jgi:hypothetical protein
MKSHKRAKSGPVRVEDEVGPSPTGSIVIEVSVPTVINGLNSEQTKAFRLNVKKDPTTVLGTEAFIVYHTCKGIPPKYLLGNVVGVVCEPARDVVKLHVTIDSSFGKTWPQDTYSLHGIRNRQTVSAQPVSG